MNYFPPAILDMRFPRVDGRRFHLWLPIFLLWPLLWLLELLILVPAIVADVVLWLLGQEYHHYSLLLLRCFGLLGETRGMIVRVKAKQADIDVTIV